MCLNINCASYQVQTEVLEQKLPKSATEPWFNLNVESSDKTAGGALDLILRLRGEIQLLVMFS